MRPTLSLVVVVIWVAAVVVAFAAYQFGGVVKASPFLDYVASILKVLSAAIAAAAVGLRILATPRPRLKDLVIGLAVGLAVFGVATLAIAGARMLRPYVIWPALVLAVALCRREVIAILRCFRPRALGLDYFEAASGGLIVLGSLVLLANCLAPLTATDALVYHLNLPKIYTASSGLVKMPYNVYANMPHYGEMLYAFFYTLAGEAGARLAYCLIVIATMLSVYVLARRFASRRLAMGAATFFLVEPLILDGRIVCNVDLLLGYAYLAAIILLLEPPPGKTSARQIVPVGILAGFMLGIKYTAVVPCLSLLAIPLVGTLKRPSVRTLLLACLVAAAIFVPWLVKNQAYVGNPVYPVFERTFGGANWDATQEAQLLRWQRSMGMGRDFSRYLLLPFNVSTRGKPAMNYAFFDGTMTPLILVLLPLALLKRSRETLTLAAMAAAVFVFWALTSQQLRFLVPAIALGAALGASGLSNLARIAGPRRAGIVLGFAILTAGLTLIVPDHYGRPFVAGAIAEKLPVDLGLESRQQYLDRTVQSFNMFDYIRRSLPAREPIFLIWENRAYYLDNPYFADSFFEASSVMRLVAASRDANDLEQTLRRMGFKYVVTNDMLGEFFSRYYSPTEVAKLKEFLTNRLDVVHSSNKLTLYALRP